MLCTGYISVGYAHFFTELSIMNPKFATKNDPMYGDSVTSHIPFHGPGFLFFWLMLTQGTIQDIKFDLSDVLAVDTTLTRPYPKARL